MSGGPTLTCPTCGSTLEYHLTVEMLDPPIGKIDTGYCAKCARLFERVRQLGAYEPTLWLPLCRQCRQPVVCIEVGADTTVFQCRDHPAERWTWDRVERWKRD